MRLKCVVAPFRWFGAFNSMDRPLITLLLDETPMGLYAMRFALAQVLALFPTAIGQVYYLRMTELYAAKGLSRELTRRCLDASLLSATIVGVLAIGAFFSMPWLIVEYFPKYAGGLPALKVALIAYFVLSLAAGPTCFVVSTMQKGRQLAALAARILVMFTCARALSAYELIGIAWSRVIGATVYVSGLWVIVLRPHSATRSAVP